MGRCLCPRERVQTAFRRIALGPDNCRWGLKAGCHQLLAVAAVTWTDDQHLIALNPPPTDLTFCFICIYIYMYTFEGSLGPIQTRSFFEDTGRDGILCYST